MRPSPAKLARSFAQPATYLGIAMMLLVHGTASYLIASDRAEAEKSAQRREGNMVRIVDHSFSDIFKSADLNLRFLRRLHEKNPATFDLTDWVRVSSLPGDPVLNIAITDASGLVVQASTSKQMIGHSLAGRAHFSAQANTSEDKLFISEPVTAISSGTPVLILSRKIQHPDGTFAGIIAARLDLSRLAQLMTGIDLGPGGAVTLVGLDGILRLRVSDGEIDIKNIGQKLRSSNSVTSHAAQARSGEFWSQPGRFGAVRRLISYRQLEAFPLIAAVSTSEAEVFRSANESAAQYRYNALLLTGCILIAILLGAWREWRLIETTSEMQQAQDALRRSQERYQLVEAAVSDGLWDWNILTDEYFRSLRGDQILGYSGDELPYLRSAFVKLIHPGDKAAVLAAIQAHIDVGVPYAMDYRVRCKDGSYRWVHSRGQAIRDGAGRAVRMLGAITDITERKEAEAALALANQNLEQRVAERTAELAREMRRREEAQAALAQAGKMDAVGQLTAGIAHDFNNLLAVIQGSLRFVAEAEARGLTAEPELIDAALRASRRGAELVRRLLAFSRQQPLKAEPTAVDRMVLDTLRLLKRTLGEHVNIETRLNTAGAQVSVDRSQLANALLNLALNARDAMPEGGQLRIETSSEPSPWTASEGANRWPTGEAIRIAIIDTGTGMTEQVRSRAFEPFFTTKPDGLGTGLGLSMVHGFVQQSGGHIDIESEPGRGTTITIHLPRVEASAVEAEVSAESIAPAADNALTVLLVEDDPDVRVVTAAQLRQLGYRVQTVQNGHEAIDLIGSPAEIDIMLTDVVLPGGIDGVSLLKEAMRARPGLGVLCMSGYDPSRDHRRWLQIQNIEFLEKPFSIARLAQSLEATCASEGTAAHG